MTTDLVRRWEPLASVLQRPLLSDATRLAISLQADGGVRRFDVSDASNPLGRVQANGVGRYCRWMVTDDALVIVRPDGNFVARPRPASLPNNGGDAYRTAFSFSAADADLIVLSGDKTTHVLRVTASDVHAQALPLAVRCVCGLAGEGDAYALYGQSPRTADGEPGVAVVVQIVGDRYTAEPVAAGGRTALESVVAVLRSVPQPVLVGAEVPAAPQPEDFERLTTPLRSDHDTFTVLRAGAEQVATVSNARFVAAGGAPGQERAYFQKHQSSAATSPWAVLLSVDAAGSVRSHELVGLGIRSTVSQLQFDPLVGWIGIAAEHGDTREHRFLLSQEGTFWNTVAFAPESQGELS